MSIAIIHSRALVGVHAPSVAVEVHVAGGLPGIHLVGLPDTEVREARDRVRAALQNAKFEVPARKVVINLAPADLPKESRNYRTRTTCRVSQNPADAPYNYSASASRACLKARRAF